MHADRTTEPNMVSALALLHVLPHASTEAHRPILQGVYFRPDGVVAATNGHTLGMYQAGHTVPGGVILQFPKGAAGILKRTLSRAKGHDREVFVRADDLGRWRMDSPWTGESVALEAVEGPYPNIEQVLPWNERFAPVERIAVDQAKLARFYVHDRAGRVALRFQASERAIGVTTADPKFYGLLMPLRIVDAQVSSNVPSWTREFKPAECAA